MTPASSSQSQSGEGGSAGDRRSFVRFSTEGPLEQEVLPYSVIYGEHPRKFFFGRSGEKVPADCSGSCHRGRWHVQAGSDVGPVPSSKTAGGAHPPPAPPPSPRDGTGSAKAEAAHLVGLESRLRCLSGLHQHQRTLLRLGASLVKASSMCGTQEDPPASAKEVLLAALAQAKAPPVGHSTGMSRSSSASSLCRPTRVCRPSPPVSLTSCERASDGHAASTVCSLEQAQEAMGHKCEPRQGDNRCVGTERGPASAAHPAQGVGDRALVSIALAAP